MRHNNWKVNISRLTVAVMVLLLLLPLIPTALAASGTCGDGVSWEVTGGLLIISGSGSMQDYSELELAPWQQYADTIRAVVVSEGVTGIGDFAFFKMEKLETVRLASSVQTVGSWAFYHCIALRIIDLGGVREIEQSAFERCISLLSVRLPYTLTTLGHQAFYRCESLVNVRIPSSVTKMDTAVFAYCINLSNATVAATVEELPLWTFYGCESLKRVSLTANITTIGTEAFDRCENLEQAYYGGAQSELQGYMPPVKEFVPYMEPSESEKIEINTSGTVQDANGETVTTENRYTATNDSIIDTTIEQTTEKVTARIEAVIENEDGWDDFVKQLTTSMNRANEVAVDVWLKTDTTVAGENLEHIAGNNVTVTIHTAQGAQWHIDGSLLTSGSLSEKYDLSYTLEKLTNPNEAQEKTLNGHSGYVLKFHGPVDFMVSVELPLSKELYLQSAVFFTPEKDGYARRQAVMIDREGIARFYLGQVDSEQEYLIGINVPQQAAPNQQQPVSDVIIPDSMKNEFPKLAQTNEINYIITGTKSSLGINIGQLTIILAAVMVTSAVVVAVVMRVNFKRKLKAGYVPDMSYEEDEEE